MQQTTCNYMMTLIIKVKISTVHLLISEDIRHTRSRIFSEFVSNNVGDIYVDNLVFVCIAHEDLF
jgi:hypothetical protein